MDAGEVVGIAGPNGAGKSTLIAMLLGLIPPSDGVVRIDGIAPRAFVEREGIAYLPELMNLPLEWRTAESLDRLATLGGIAPATRAVARERVIEAAGIAEHRSKRLKQLSKGNLQRLGLAAALLSERRVVVFDEPTHGLDPMWTARFRDIVGGLRRSDRAMVIASHNLDELERLCDRVAILDKGKVQQVVTVRGVDGTSTVSVRRWRIRVVSGAEVVAGHLPGAKVDGEIVECECDLPAMNRALAAAIAGGALVGAVAPVESSLEEAFRVSVTR